MGIDGHGTEFMLLAHACGVDFDSTVTIGRQEWTASAAEVHRIVASLPDHGALAEVFGTRGSRYAEDLFRMLGASSVDAIDASDFEGASIRHDLNHPIGEELTERFTAVLDGGALEHVFDFPTAIENCMKLVAPGGHLMAMVPANDQVGHGFYQFGPELYYRTLCPENGFEVQHVLLQVRGLRDRWYELADPAAVGSRVEFSTAGPADLYVLARRVGAPGLHVVPQPQDYVSMWSSPGGLAVGEPTRSELRRRRMHRALGAMGPRARNVRRALGTVARARGTRRVHLPELVARAGLRGTSHGRATPAS